MKQLIRLVLFVLMSSHSLAEEIFDVELAFDKNNRIVLPVPFEDLIIDYSNAYEYIAAKEGQELIVRPRSGAKPSVQFTVILQNGDVFQMNFTYREKEQPTIFRYKNAPDIPVKPFETPGDRQLWMERVFITAHQIFYGASKKIPGMTPVKIKDKWYLEVEDKGHVKTIILDPVFAFSGLDKTLRAYEIQSDSIVEIENSDFNSEGTIAVVLESDMVTPSLSPYLFILSED